MTQYVYYEILLNDNPEGTRKGRKAMLESPPSCDMPPVTVSFRDSVTGELLTFLHESEWANGS